MKYLIEIKIIQVEKAAQKRGISGLTRPLAVKLIARERSVAMKRRTKDAVATKEKLGKHVKQLSAPVTGLQMRM